MNDNIVMAPCGGVLLDSENFVVGSDKVIRLVSGGGGNSAVYTIWSGHFTGRSGGEVDAISLPSDVVLSDYNLIMGLFKDKFSRTSCVIGIPPTQAAGEGSTTHLCLSLYVPPQSAESGSSVASFQEIVVYGSENAAYPNTIRCPLNRAVTYSQNATNYYLWENEFTTLFGIKL